MTNISEGDGLNNTYPTVTVKLVIERDPSYFITNVIIPSLFLSHLSIFVFLLPNESGEKTSLQVTVVFSYLILLLFVADVIPAAGKHLSLMAHYLIGCQCLAIICLLCIIFIINIYHRKSSKPVPPYLRVLTNLSKKQPVKNVSFTAKQNNRKPSHRHLNIKTIHRNNLPGHLYLNGEIEQFEIDNDILDTLSSNETESGKCQRCH